MHTMKNIFLKYIYEVLVQIRDLHFRSVTLVKTYTVLDVFFFCFQYLSTYLY